VIVVLHARNAGFAQNIDEMAAVRGAAVQCGSRRMSRAKFVLLSSRPTRDAWSRSLFRPPLKHPYKHPYGIAPCFPERLKRAQSTQIGTHDTVILRIRYAVPALISEARFVLRIGLDGLECGMVGTLVRTLIRSITQSKLIHGVGAVR